MYYFIPAWYGQTDEFWKTVIDPWYRIRQKIEFDDSLHQVRIFQDEDLAPQLLLLAYQPHLRYFLHRHDVLEVGYTAIFDLIQGITDEDMKNLQVTGQKGLPLFTHHLLSWCNANTSVMPRLSLAQKALLA